MNSQQNVLQVLACGFTGPQATQNALADLPVGELAFYDKTNVRQTSGAGRFVLNNGGKFIESNYLVSFAGWSLKSYAAPVLHQETILIPAPVAGKVYMIQVILDIKGMTGKYIKHGVYKAQTSDTAIIVATALVASLNNALAREGNTAITVANSGTATVTITGKLQTYEAGKKLGFQVPFTSSLSSPEGEEIAGSIGLVSATGTVTLSGGSGSFDSITVNSVEIMSGSEAYDTSPTVTATAVAANITAHTSVPNYSAVAVGAVVTITADDGGIGPNGFVVVGTGTTMTSVDVNMSGGSALVGDNGVGTGPYVHAKEYFAWGNQDSFRYNSFRNNFTPKTLSDSAKTYNVQAVNEDVYQKTAHADVRTSLQILLAFDSAGSAPAT